MKKPVGRPRIHDKRTETVYVRLTKAEKQYLDDTYGKYSKSRVIREAIKPLFSDIRY